jgi:hypothetical protein
MVVPRYFGNSFTQLPVETDQMPPTLSPYPQNNLIFFVEKGAIVDNYYAIMFIMRLNCRQQVQGCLGELLYRGVNLWKNISAYGMMLSKN